MNYHLIIQGPYHNDHKLKTRKSIVSAIQSSIFSKITLSTYEHPDLDDWINSYDIDVLINEDPGSQGWEESRNKNQNINRQIKTFINAVEVNKFDFTLKMRSDCYIKDPLKLNQVIGDFMTSNKTLFFTDTTSVRFDNKYPPTLYHLSDWTLGFKKEKSTLIKDIKYIDEKANEDWLSKQKPEIKKMYKKENLSIRYGAEVWITLNLLSKSKFAIDHCLDYSLSAEKQYKKSLEEVMCVPMYSMGMRSMKMRTVHIPHSGRYENYLSPMEKLIYSIVGSFYKIYVSIRQLI